MKSRAYLGFVSAWRSFAEILTCVTKRTFTEGVTYTAGTLTYTTILSIVPITVVAIMILSVFPEFNKVVVEVQNFLIQNFVPEVGDVIRDNLNSIVSQAKRLPVTGLVFLVVLAVLMILMVEKALNGIWHIPGRRKGISALLRYWAIITLAPVIVGASITATSYLISLPFLYPHGMSTIATRVLAVAIPWLLTVIAFTLIYVIVPNCRVPWRDAFVGALLASVALEIAKKIFVFYVTQFPTYKVLYGTLAAIPIFLLWIFISWVIILIGAILANELSMRRVQRRQKGNFSAFSSSLMWLYYLWKAQTVGKSVSLLELFALHVSDKSVQPQLQLQVLIGAKLVRLVGRSQVLLVRDLHKYTLKELYHDMPWKLSAEGMQEFCQKLYGKIHLIETDIEQALTEPVAHLFAEEQKQ